MKKFKELVNEIYEPNTPDEAKFVNMHNVKTFDYPVKNDHGLPFRDDRIKTAGPQHKKPATYDPPKEPAAVYTKANEEVIDEAGAFSYGVKPPRKGSEAYFAAKAQKNYDKANPPIEPKDQKVGNAKVTKEGKAEDDAVKDYLAKGGKVTVGKTKNAKGIEYMRGMSRQKGSSAAAKMSYKEEVEQVDEMNKSGRPPGKEVSQSQHLAIKKAEDEKAKQDAAKMTPNQRERAALIKKKFGVKEEAEIIEKKLPSMHVYVTPTGAGKHEVVTLSHDVEADHPSKPGTPLEPGHTLSDKDVEALKKSGHTVASDTELDEAYYEIRGQDGKLLHVSKFSGSVTKVALEHTKAGKTVTIRSHDEQRSPIDTVSVKQGDHVKSAVESLKTKREKMTESELDEKTLTPAEMKKREEVAKAIKREHPGMPMAMKMAIATKTAKRVAEETAELRLLMGLNPEADINEAFETDDILSLLQVVSDKDTVAEIFLEEGEDGLLIDKEVADILLAVYESLDEESREKFEYALTESYDGFDYCVDFSVKFLEEETE